MLTRIRGTMLIGLLFTGIKNHSEHAAFDNKLINQKTKALKGKKVR
jgi:hypothetical protein